MDTICRIIKFDFVVYKKSDYRFESSNNKDFRVFVVYIV